MKYQIDLDLEKEELDRVFKGYQRSTRRRENYRIST